MAPPSTILVVGATGKQGGAVIEELLKLPSPPAKILALTRDSNSAKAKALEASKPGVISLVQGDITAPEPVFAGLEKASVDAVFVVTLPGKVGEDKQAIPFIDAAVAHGVKHVVFTSVERGGDEHSWNNPTNIKHFYEKHAVELHIRDKAADGSFTWTILRPTAFLDNFNPGGFGSMFPAMWSLQPRL